MPRQMLLAPGCRAPRAAAALSARISAIACSATARALTPRALARRMPAAPSASRVILVGAGADRLDELQLACDFGEFVAPHHGDDHHVGLWNARLELVKGAHLEMGDIRIAPGELLGHAIGGVGKADGEFVPRGERALRSRVLR